MKQRELRFRVWDIEEKKWTSREIFIGNGYVGLEDTDLFIVQQFTGCYDGDGKEIYEGDVLDITHDSGNHYLGQIVFESFGWYVKTDFHNWHIGLNRLTNKLDCFKSFVITGNILEHSHLISTTKT